jgi:O-antigen ligase
MKELGMPALTRTFSAVEPPRLDTGVRSRAGVPTHFIQSVLALGALSAWTNWGLDVGFQQLSPVQFASAFAFALTLLNGLVLSKRRIHIFTPILFPSLVVLLAAIASMINAADTFDSIRFLGRYIYGLMFVYAIIGLIGGHYKLCCRVVRMFIIGGCGTTFVCIAANYNSQLAGIVFDDLFNRRAQGFLSHPNQLAMLYLTSLVLLFWPNVFNPHVKILVFFPLMIGLLITGSKFNLGLVALVVPILLIYLPFRERRHIEALRNILILLPTGVIFIAGAALTIQANSQLYYKRVVSFFDDPMGADTTSIRFLIWEQAYNCFERNVFFGIGAGNAQQCIPYSHAHNFIINYALEMGLLGLFSLALLLGGGAVLMLRANINARRLFNLYKSSKLYRATGVLIVALVGFMISNLSSDSLGPATMPTLWILFGLATAVYLQSTCTHDYNTK